MNPDNPRPLFVSSKRPEPPPSRLVREDGVSTLSTLSTGSTGSTFTNSVFLQLVFFALAMIIGTLATFLYLESSRASMLAAQIESTQTSERTAWGKFHDLQEKQQDEAFSAEASMHAKLYETEQALAECKSINRPKEGKK